jgi:nitroimidazol reductase NimA-like FMN-containing flavoprotein (pyridoxamine 5'-phosphate oxidase superfamily)
MFREMRRFKQALTNDDCINILTRNTSGVLAVSGDEGYPYSVPLSYVFDNSKLFFHCALVGHKIDSIDRNNKVSFCIIDKDQIVPEKYTTYFRSVIVFGKAKILDNEQEKRAAMEILARKYSPHDEKGIQKEIDKSFKQVCIIEVSVEYISGKEAIELVKEKQSS